MTKLATLPSRPSDRVGGVTAAELVALDGVIDGDPVLREGGRRVMTPAAQRQSFDLDAVAPRTRAWESSWASSETKKTTAAAIPVAQ